MLCFFYKFVALNYNYMIIVLFILYCNLAFSLYMA